MGQAVLTGAGRGVPMPDEGVWDAACAARVRTNLLGGLDGEVLEIGPGPGVNLALFPTGVRWIGLEPGLARHDQIQREAARLGRPVRILSGVAEEIPMPSRSVDAVVGTLVLCSVVDVARVLAEIRRVLRLGGRYVFVEHVAAAPGSWTRRVQDLWAPLSGRWYGGCRPNRDSGRAIERAGFAAVHGVRFARPGPLRVAIPYVAGVAVA